ncbi:protein adenylyltransferase SelO [Ideonella livida]|uniref:Protein nucleotidyltransferase YdiU n=1 Tax=Ideonella livida TaxID=2707176 RepID=A0A7C9THT0_9BURK|nr:YdiU family protein [Ideonella livida]NDY90761.1 YdiU family protein [Ideonella livida]
MSAPSTPAGHATSPGAHWINRFAQLPARFHTRLQAQGLPDPHWVITSDDCAALLGWPTDWWQAAAPAEQASALAVFSGQTRWPGMDPLATVYSGHQFGHWAGQLGDGRALWLGELQGPEGPLELQLKGAGRTPYSRMGDGRAVLRSSLREFLASEAMHHLGIPTTRALCLTGSALPVRRERVETAAVLTRVAPSFLRFGHFEHFCHHGQHDDLRTLLDFVLQHLMPGCRARPDPALAVLEEVTRLSADLVAQWQAVGFCHGVLNTDNMSLLGLTLDYGPFGFLDGYDPQHICNHSDERGRYAYAAQPNIVWWNLHALAQALLPLVGSGQGEETDILALQEVLGRFAPHFQARTQALWRAKLGLRQAEEEDATLVSDWLALLAAERVDFTIAHRRLSAYDPAEPSTLTPLRDLFVAPQGLHAWAQRLADRVAREGLPGPQRLAAMRACNPKYVLRNHLAELAIRDAEVGDFGFLQRLHQVLRRPFEEQPEHEALAGFPPDWAGQLCVSCSS